VKNPKIKLTVVAHVDVPPNTFAHLNDVVDCISWHQDHQHWECAKDDLLVELKQFNPHNVGVKQEAVFKWLQKLVVRIPGIVEYVVFCEDE
jgi:hypothetical protein